MTRAGDGDLRARGRSSGAQSRGSMGLDPHSYRMSPNSCDKAPLKPLQGEQRCL